MYTANRQVDEVRHDRGIQQSSSTGVDFMMLQAQARAMRAEVTAELIGRGFRRAGAGLRAIWSGLESRRRDRSLRRELGQLDAHTLRDLGLSPLQVPSVTWASLSDHPMTAHPMTAAPAAAEAALQPVSGAVSGPDSGAANENSARKGVRTAA